MTGSKFGVTRVKFRMVGIKFGVAGGKLEMGMYARDCGDLTLADRSRVHDDAGLASCFKNWKRRGGII